MIKNSKKLREFEKKFIRNYRLSYQEALKIYEAMHLEALRLNKLSIKKELKDSPTIKISRIVNYLKSSW